MTKKKGLRKPTSPVKKIKKPDSASKTAATTKQVIKKTKERAKKKGY